MDLHFAIQALQTVLNAALDTIGRAVGYTVEASLHVEKNLVRVLGVSLEVLREQREGIVVGCAIVRGSIPVVGAELEGRFEDSDGFIVRGMVRDPQA
jgi:hypothetical protein